MTEPRRTAPPKIPRGKARRREILVHSARIFLRDGLDGTSMDAIAAEAGTSKATLYRHFTDRHGLAVQVVEFLCAEFLSDIDLAPAPDPDLRAGLLRVLSQLAHVLSKPDHPAFFRLITAGAARDPAIGQAWHVHGPRLWHRRLHDVFAAHAPASCDFTDFPEILFDAVFADFIIRTAILGTTEPRSLEPGRYIEKLVDSILAAA